MSAFSMSVMGLVVLQRLAELRLASRNGKRILLRGGYEAGAEHYKYLVMLHSGFLLALLAEIVLRGPVLPVWWAVPFAMFIAAQAFRVWCICSLGEHWNTRIYVVPGMKLVRRGPYRWLKHPNYAVVTLELLTLPLVFGAYGTAAAALVCNALILRKRIAVEEAALQEAAQHEAAQHEAAQHEAALHEAGQHETVQHETAGERTV